MIGRYLGASFECHDILMLGKCPIKRRQRPDMTIAVDWDVKHLFKQTVGCSSVLTLLGPI